MSTFTKGHTPGPWRAEWLDDDNGWIMDSEGKYLAEIVTTDSEGKCASSDEQIANAALMSAAPDLLTVLQEFMKDVEAVGVSNLSTKGNDVDDIDWPDLLVTYNHARTVIAKAKCELHEIKSLPTEKNHGDDTEFGVTRWSWADIECSIADILRNENDDVVSGDEGEEERMTIAIALAGKYGAVIAEKADRVISEAQCTVGWEVLENIVREVITSDELTIKKVVTE